MSLNPKEDWMDRPCSCAGDYEYSFLRMRNPSGSYEVPEEFVYQETVSDVEFNDLGASIRKEEWRADVWKCPYCGEEFRAERDVVNEEVTFKEVLEEESTDEGSPGEKSGGLLSRLFSL